LAEDIVPLIENHISHPEDEELYERLQVAMIKGNKEAQKLSKMLPEGDLIPFLKQNEQYTRRIQGISDKLHSVEGKVRELAPKFVEVLD
jgi:hypothetical protein